MNSAIIWGVGSCRLWVGAVFFFLGGYVLAITYQKPVPVPEPKGTRAWKFIVIHHSGAGVGNEAMIEWGHLQRGMENGMAYHFLIGNGSAKLGDGDVVEGRRWKYQLHGGHSHHELLNEKGVGICLVGNFSKKQPTPAQLQSLARLVLKLQEEFAISDDAIHGHGDFFGEESDCPGRLFPWDGFWKELNALYIEDYEKRSKGGWALQEESASSRLWVH